MAGQDVEQTLQELQRLTDKPPADPKLRKRLYDASQKLGLAIESPYDTIYRIIYSPITLTVAEIASKLQIFQTLTAAGGKNLRAAELATPPKADPILCTRIARCLASHGMIDEIDSDLYTANHITRSLSSEGFRAGIKHYFNATMPCLQAAPRFLEETGYANPSDMDHTPFQYAFETDLPRFQWMKGRPDISTNFGVWMTAQHDSQMTWLDVIDFADLTRGTNPSTPVFVDVGGGVGHQCALLRKRYPDLAGDVVLQDSGSVLARALPVDGVEKMPYDFWTEQPVKGARVYYMRYIMHDYPDDKCAAILKNTRAAMDSGSVILIDDVIIPDRGSHSHSTDKDIAMMVNFAAMERSQTQWLSLFHSAGLKLSTAATYNAMSGESIQAVTLMK